MRTGFAISLASVVLLATVGCATANNAGTAARPDALSNTLYDAKTGSVPLVASEIEKATTASSILEAVRQLRPLFLRPRPSASTMRGQRPTLAVYINDMYAGGADVLATIPPNAVEKVRYLQRSEAMVFAGTMTPGDGFLMVQLKTMGRR